MEYGREVEAPFDLRDERLEQALDGVPGDEACVVSCLQMHTKSKFGRGSRFNLELLLLGSRLTNGKKVKVPTRIVHPFRLAVLLPMPCMVTSKFEYVRFQN